MTLTVRSVRNAMAAIVVVALAIPSLAFAQSFTFTKIVDTYTPIPGSTTQTFSFNNSDVPAINSVRRLVFDTSDMSVWTAYPDGSQLTKVLDTNTPIPGWSGTFQEFYGDSVQIFNQTVVLIGFDCGGCTSGVGVYTVWASGGTVRKLVDKNTPVPGGAVNFGSFVTDFTTAPSGWSGIPFHQATGYVVFQNSQQVYAVPLFLGGNANDVAGNWDSSYSPPSPYCCIADSPSLNGGTVALRMGNVFGHASVQTVNRQGDPLSFRVIADRNTQHPVALLGTFLTISRWARQ